MQHKATVFKNELRAIKDQRIRNFAILLLNEAPDYFYHEPASSTGKYHPKYALGEKGLVRHTKAVVRFYNYIVTLEQYKNKLQDNEEDLGRVACLIHDALKYGDQKEYQDKINNGKKAYTCVDHPIRAALYIKLKAEESELNDSEITVLMRAVSSHMGEWNTDRNKKEILPKPTEFLQEIVHLADYLASRKDLDVDFHDDLDAYPNEEVDAIICEFPKYKGMKYVDVYQEDPQYLHWLYDNVKLNNRVKQTLEKLFETEASKKV